MKIGSLFILALFLFNCRQVKEPDNKEEMECTIEPAKNFHTINQLTVVFREDVVEGMASANEPDANGAMGRNKNAYFHVRFQMGIAELASFALARQRTDALEMAFKAIEYSFSYQKSSGDFELNVPDNLLYLGMPTDADLASGTAFFTFSLGSALLAFEESAWVQSQTAYKNRTQLLKPKLILLLTYLKTQKNNLQKADQAAPNRLLYNAVAFYSLGKHLQDDEAKLLGIDFAKKALALQDPKGYYLEGGGYDSSYQGVALSVGFRLLTLLDPGENFRDSLYQSLACGTYWQCTRIKNNGEISTEGNTRVYAGGEQFLGDEKRIAWLTTLTALLAYQAYTGNSRYGELAQKLIQFYK